MSETKTRSNPCFVKFFPVTQFVHKIPRSRVLKPPAAFSSRFGTISRKMLRSLHSYIVRFYRNTIESICRWNLNVTRVGCLHSRPIPYPSSVTSYFSNPFRVKTFCFCILHSTYWKDLKKFRKLWWNEKEMQVTWLSLATQT